MDLAEVLVSLDNTDADELWLSVEDDGQATGLHAEYMDWTGLAVRRQDTQGLIPAPFTQNSVHPQGMVRAIAGR